MVKQLQNGISSTSVPIALGCWRCLGRAALKHEQQCLLKSSLRLESVSRYGVGVDRIVEAEREQ